MNVYNAKKRNRLHETLVQTRLSNKQTSQVRWYSFHYNVRARCPHKLFWSQTSACNRSIARTFPLPGAVAATLGSRCCFAVGSADFGEPIASAADWKTDAVDEQNPTNEFLCNSSHWFLGCMPWKKGNISPSCIFCWNRPILSGKKSEKWGAHPVDLIHVGLPWRHQLIGWRRFAGDSPLMDVGEETECMYQEFSPSTKRSYTFASMWWWFK